jgi:hypothetical protein
MIKVQNKVQATITLTLNETEASILLALLGHIASGSEVAVEINWLANELRRVAADRYYVDLANGIQVRSKE